MESIPLKQRIAQLLPKGEAAAWLAGLELEGTPPEFSVYFIHPLFAAWFLEQKKPLLESVLRKCFPEFGELAITYRSKSLDRGTLEIPASARRPEPEYLVTKKNSFACAAVFQIAENPAPQLIMLFGESGTGKTHLLRALHARLQNRNLAQRIIFASARDLLRTREVTGFFNFEACFLLLDDSHVLMRDRIMQDKLADFIDASAGRAAMVLGWMGKRSHLRLQSPRLMSHLGSSLAVELPDEDLELRIRRLEKLNSGFGLRLSRDQILVLARKLPGNAEIDGLTRKIAFFQQHFGRAPELVEVDSLAHSQGAIPPEDWRAILERVARKFGMSVQAVLAPGRKPEKVLARQLGMYICRKNLGLSYPQIGKLFGGKDHSTVMHAVNKIEEMARADKNMHNLIQELTISAKDAPRTGQ